MRALVPLQLFLSAASSFRSNVFSEERCKRAKPDQPVFFMMRFRNMYIGRGRGLSRGGNKLAGVNAGTSGFQAYQKAVRNNKGDLRVALAESSKQLTPQSGPRVIQHTTRSNKVIDTEKTLEKKELKADGLIVTEKKRTVEHEEVSLAKTC